MLYGCIHTATVGVKGLKATVRPSMGLDKILISSLCSKSRVQFNETARAHVE